MPAKIFAPCMRDKGTIGKKRQLEMITYEIVFLEASKRYQAQGENPACKGKLTRFVTKDVAIQWEKETGKKAIVVKDTPEKKAAREAKAQRKRDRKEKKKQKEKEQRKKERMKAKKMNA